MIDSLSHISAFDRQTFWEEPGQYGITYHPTRRIITIPKRQEEMGIGFKHRPVSGDSLTCSDDAHLESS